MRSALVILGLLAATLGAGCLEATMDGAPVASEPLREAVTTEPGWPSLDDARIRPGVLVETGSRTCPSNFVFARPDNTSIFLGITAACVSDKVVGDIVLLDPGRTDATGVIIYHSWMTMDEIGTDDADAREYNDFAVIRVDTAYRHLVHPAVLRVGGPVAMGDPNTVTIGDSLISYGAPDAGALDLGPSRGLVTGKVGTWALLVHGALPSLPGRMGTGAMTPEGAAIGLTVNLGVTPNPGANGVARLDAVMAYALEHANLEMDLQTWPLLDTSGFPNADPTSLTPSLK